MKEGAGTTAEGQGTVAEARDATAAGVEARDAIAGEMAAEAEVLPSAHERYPLVIFDGGPLQPLPGQLGLAPLELVPFVLPQHHGLHRPGAQVLSALGTPPLLPSVPGVPSL